MNAVTYQQLLNMKELQVKSNLSKQRQSNALKPTEQYKRFMSSIGK